MSDARSIRIAVTAMGGQGGGVLASWIVRLGERAGYLAQSTSVPGVAQRTGATIYYVELFPEAQARNKGKAPVLALMPAAGDVDIVIAAEFMEAGRAIARGFVSDRTTLIASSHRDYAIAEKIAMGDGRQSTEAVRASAKKVARRFIEADMATAAADAGAVISAVLFGALAGAGALPISREIFEDTIKADGRAVEANLRGFGKGFELAATSAPHKTFSEREENNKTGPSPAVRPLLERMRKELPPELHSVVVKGLDRCVDYQSIRHAELYLDRLNEVVAADRASGAGKNYRLSLIAARHLALWMTYEDSIRVADLKTRASRFHRFRKDVNAEEGQIIVVHEFLHPRVEEVCDILPAGLARSILKGRLRRRLLMLLLGEGKRVPTTKLRGFLQLWVLSKLRFMRPRSFRFAIEDARIRQWLNWVIGYASVDYDTACEIAAMQRLLKGYGETFERGLANFNTILARVDQIARQPNGAATLAALREAALADEHGVALEKALNEMQPSLQAAE